MGGGGGGVKRKLTIYVRPTHLCWVFAMFYLMDFLVNSSYTAMECRRGEQSCCQPDLEEGDVRTWTWSVRIVATKKRERTSRTRSQIITALAVKHHIGWM